MHSASAGHGVTTRPLGSLHQACGRFLSADCKDRSTTVSFLARVVHIQLEVRMHEVPATAFENCPDILKVDWEMYYNLTGILNLHTYVCGYVYVIATYVAACLLKCEL